MVNFSEAFYNNSLFLNGERAYFTEEGGFEVLPKESRCSRFKRFLTFRQDPNIEAVHNQLKRVMGQIDKQSGRNYNALVDEVHGRGEAKFKCLRKNLERLREKLDRTGHLNCFSRFILKIINFVRCLFCAAPIKLKNYAEITFERSIVSNDILKITHPSFKIEICKLEENASKVTEADRLNCGYFVESSDSRISEKIIKLQKEWLNAFLIQETSKDYKMWCQVWSYLEITFDSEKQQFLLTLRNPHEDTTIMKELADHLTAVDEVENTIRYHVKMERNYGSTTDISFHELVWKFTPTESEPLRLNKGPSPLVLEPDVKYTILDASGEVVQSTFTIKKAIKKTI